MAASDNDVIRYSVPVTAELDDAVRKRMREGGFSSIAEYVRTAVRAESERAQEQRLERLLLKGIESGDGTEVTPEYWERRQQALSARLARRDDG